MKKKNVLRNTMSSNTLSAVQWTAEHPVQLYVSAWYVYAFWIAQLNHADVFAFVVCYCCLVFWLFIHSLFFRYFNNMQFFSVSVSVSVSFSLLCFALLLSYRASFISSSLFFFYSFFFSLHHNRHHNHHPVRLFY